MFARVWFTEIRKSGNIISMETLMKAFPSQKSQARSSFPPRFSAILPEAAKETLMRGWRQRVCDLPPAVFQLPAFVRQGGFMESLPAGVHL